ncbi:MFS transporter [Piscinibacter koreensis]|uniref:MFS transporter n=1 Tax=Piscinibacter koreensis TaxID=2742824 RepID=A0A7Y6NLA2_9BURK|nr:MFS transporter [Schlegelella koreensis]NUZ05247.1 MFS transporter [Schlegelella koreensis]
MSPKAPEAAAVPAASRRRMAFWLVLLAAAGTFAVTMGARQSMGLFIGALNTSTGLGLAAISLAFGFGQLWWGLTQPFAGMVADRWGSGRVIVVGVLMVALGTALVPFASTTWGLVLVIGVLAAGGAGLAGVSVLMAATSRLVAPERRGIASGIVNAGGSFGQFVFAPIATGVMAIGGWVASLQTLALVTLLALPAAWVLRGTARSDAKLAGAAAPRAEPVRQALGRAFANPSYGLLCAGFFVCGFHVAFIATHLPGVIAACGLPANVAGWALGIIGLFNIVGSLAMGWAVGRWRMKSLLALVYAARGVAVLAFVLAPKTTPVVIVFSAFIGLTYLSTVPPTAGLVAKFFGTANMAMLFGIVMLSHQVGGFLGAWLGGKAYEASGNYDWMWYADILLAAAAALVNLPIREAPVARRAAVAA